MKIKSEIFGPLNKYIDNDEITDIDFNGKSLWIRDIYCERKCVIDEEITPDWINIFTEKVADFVSQPFNKIDVVLEAETENLRITSVHEQNAISGRAVCIRKTSIFPRITMKNAIENKYASEKVLSFLINCLRSKMNIVICGNPGAGKTELAKFLSLYIPPEEKVITIEDNPEWHYRKLREEADCIEFKINDKSFDYLKSLKTSIRLSPDWIMLSEVRSIEDEELLRAWSIGIKGISTLHTDEVSNIPDRFLNMMPKVNEERIENRIYEHLDMGILVTVKKLNNGKRIRYIDQVGFFERKNKQNIYAPVIDEGEFLEIAIPSNVINKFDDNGIKDYFSLEKEV